MLASTRKRESLLDAIKQENDTSQKKPKCHVAKVLESLSDEDRADLLAALEQPDLRSTVIAKVLTNRGYPVSEFSIRRHKLKRCQCGSTT